MNLFSGNKLFLILLSAILVRLAALLILGPVDPLGSDFPLFDRMAKNLLALGNFGGEPAASHYGSPNINPAFAFWLAFLYLVFGTSHTVFLAAQVVLSVLVVWGSYLLAAEIFNKKAGLITALIVALWPPFLITTIEPSSTLLYSTFFIFATYFFWKTFTTPTTRTHPNNPNRSEYSDKSFDSLGRVYSVLSGVFLGLAALTESIAFYIPLVFGVWMLGVKILKLYPDFSWRRIAITFTLLVISFSLVLAPWVLRNVSAAREAQKPEEVNIVLAKGELQMISPNNIQRIAQKFLAADFLITSFKMFISPYGLWRMDPDVWPDYEQSGVSSIINAIKNKELSTGTLAASWARIVIFLKQLFTLLHIALLALAAYVLVTQWRRPFSLLVVLLVAYVTVASIGYLAFSGGDFKALSPLSIFLLPLAPLFAALVAGKFTRA